MHYVLACMQGVYYGFCYNILICGWTYNCRNDCSIRVVSISAIWVAWQTDVKIVVIYTKIIDPDGLDNRGSTEQHYCTVLQTTLKILMCFVSDTVA